MENIRVVILIHGHRSTMVPPKPQPAQKNIIFDIPIKIGILSERRPFPLKPICALRIEIDIRAPAVTLVPHSVLIVLFPHDSATDQIPLPGHLADKQRVFGTFLPRMDDSAKRIFMSNIAVVHKKGSVPLMLA